jgi:chromate transporter
VAAWLGFTLPSAVLMTAFAFAQTTMRGSLAAGLIHGLKLVAVAVVAQAVFGMARTLTPDARRAAIALAAVAIVMFAAVTIGQIAAIAMGAVVGLFLCRADIAPAAAQSKPWLSRGWGFAALAAFFLLLLGGPLVVAVTGDGTLARFDAFYRSGALVFGGGHVVLPLLKNAVVDPGWVSQDNFLAGYGAAQAMPGPLFTFAAYLGGAMRTPPNGIAGAALGLAGIFLPGLLALLAALPFWGQLRARPTAQAAMRGANAAVVGILAAALYSPVWTSAVLDRTDFAIALSGFVLLIAFRAPPIVVVLLGAGAGVAKAVIG